MPKTSGPIFTIEVDGNPTVAFEAKRIQEATEVCHAEWFRADLSMRNLNGVPLYHPTSKLRARVSNATERAKYLAAQAPEASDDIFLFYLVEWE